MQQSRGYSVNACSRKQDEILSRMLDTAKPGNVGVFDLDGCLFDTRQRQIIIFREFASRHNIPKLYDIQPRHFSDWNLKTTLSSVGMMENEIEAIYSTLNDFWWARFFSSEYVRMDHALPAAAEFVREYYSRGADVVYMTGRDHRMRPGTEAGLLAYGFPYQAKRTRLITKSEFKQEDTAYKVESLNQIKQIGEPVLFVDNEPSNVNAFYRHCPDALTVFIETDHSPRPIEPHSELPWIRSFCTRAWHGEKWAEFEELPLRVAN